MAVEAINPAISHTEKKTGGKGKAWASVAIPGLGQFLDGRNKAGAGFLGGALALNIGNALAYRSLLKDSFTKTNNIESQSVDSMLRSFPKGKLFVIGALSLAQTALWITNIIDAYKGGIHDKPGIKEEVKK